MASDDTADEIPAIIEEAWTDPVYNRPIIEVDEERSEPVPHRYVRGRFEATDASFSFYFPPAAQYGGRFFHNTYPLALSSDIGPFPIQFDVATGDLGFTLDSGAYYVQTNLGGADRAGGPTIPFRVNAAAAKYSRVLAARFFGDHRPYGYLFGGSGGSRQVMGSAELTRGIWDGFLPYVLGSDHAIPNVFTIRLHPLRVLARRGKWASVLDGIDPGGGDPYAGLDAEEAAALREATRFGFPPRGWWNHATLTSGYLTSVAAMVASLDPTYNDDFWSKPGYLGHDAVAELQPLRRRHETSVVAVTPGLTMAVELAELPDWDVVDAHLVVLDGPHAGRSLPIAARDGGTVAFTMASDRALIASLKPGDRVRIDNDWALAMQTYHRHQVPPLAEALCGWDQYRDTAGAPIYPQRPLLAGVASAPATSGARISGRVTAKVLVLQAMLDIDALPWQADWYRAKVAGAIGERFDSDFALWFIDHAQHDDPQSIAANAVTVSFAGALQQGLRDLAAWVETGVKPAETAYTLADGQISLPDTAAARGGIQPVVTLTAGGESRVTVKAGQPVTFTALVEVPEGAGAVVVAEWDFEGEGRYPDPAPIAAPTARMTLSATHSFDRPGTYFPVIRVASQRQGDAETPYGRVQNIGRMRVVVG